MWYLRALGLWLLMNLLSHLGVKALPGTEVLREHRLRKTTKPQQRQELQGCLCPIPSHLFSCGTPSP